MKKAFIIALFFLFLLVGGAEAHSGGLDRYGGHNCYTDECYGEYHCHQCDYYQGEYDSEYDSEYDTEYDTEYDEPEPEYEEEYTEPDTSSTNPSTETESQYIASSNTEPTESNSSWLLWIMGIGGVFLLGYASGKK
jgi:hypothetical protein